METIKNCTRDKSFEASVSERTIHQADPQNIRVEQTLVYLRVQTHPEKLNHGIPTDIVTLGLTVVQARQVRDALDSYLMLNDGQ